MAKQKLFWKARPLDDDYRAANDYLALITGTARATRVVNALRRARLVHRSAKDLLRASGLPLLPPQEARVANDLKKIAKGKPLAPVLLVRGDLTKGIPLVVADGYHRICAVCHFDEFAPVAAQIADS